MRNFCNLELSVCHILLVDRIKCLVSATERQIGRQRSVKCQRRWNVDGVTWIEFHPISLGSCDWSQLIIEQTDVVSPCPVFRWVPSNIALWSISVNESRSSPSDAKWKWYPHLKIALSNFAWMGPKLAIFVEMSSWVNFRLGRWGVVSSMERTDSNAFPVTSLPNVRNVDQGKV